MILVIVGSWGVLRYMADVAAIAVAENPKTLMLWLQLWLWTVYKTFGMSRDA